jgi:ring-1,2-phenylacetyl-CoA epoxidase subunit PaaE
MTNFYPLTVSDIEQLTPNSVAVTLDIPEDLKEKFSFKAGQYITIRHHHKGSDLRRAYSISSTPKESKITIGIKKVLDGIFSVYANEQLKKGDVLDVMPPGGRFIFSPAGSAQNIAAFAAGSGITPVMSIAKTVLEAHPDNTLVLVYGNSNRQETMFYEDLHELYNKYTDRFSIQFIYSRAQETDSLFGRIEPSTVNFIVKNKHKETSFDHYYICGPEPMIHSVCDTLKGNGVAPGQIHFELFTSATKEDELAEALHGKTQLEVVLDDEVFNFTMDKKMVVLDAVLKQDIDAPYSCQGGVCSTCIARIKEGKAEMIKNQILTDGEIADGFILTCQAHPLTPVLKVDYDDV